MSPSNMTVEAWPVSDAGQAEQNQDFVLIHQPEDEDVLRRSGSLYVVADGQGGGESGMLASQYAAKKVAAVYYASDEPDLGLRLREAVSAANLDLFEHAHSQPELVKTEASIVAAVIRGEQAHIASVGGARAYLVRDGDIQRVTRDHTLVQQLLEEGAISEDEVRSHPRREVVLRTLGAEPEVQVDVSDLRLRPDDSLVFATDGLTGMLQDSEIAQIVGTSSPQQAAETLVQKATDRGAKDNVTAIAALLRAGGPPLATNVPFAWDGSEPSFDEQPTMAVTPVKREAGVEDIEAAEAAAAMAGDRTVRAERMAPRGADEVPTPADDSVPAAAEGPAVPVGMAAPEGGYAVDPETGLPPVPPEEGGAPGQPYQPRIYRPPQPAVEPPRRGVSVGLFAAVGLLAIILTALMVIILLNPFGWNIGNQPAAPVVDEPTEEPALPDTPEPTEEVVEPTADVATPEETDAAEVAPSAEPTTPVPAPEGMVLVDGGTFLRGVDDEEVDAAAELCVTESLNPDNECIRGFFTDAQPVEDVTLSPFFIDVTEVTNAGYAECVDAGVCTPPDNVEFYDDPAYGQHPVVYVTHNQANQFCLWLGKRLPTEAEWEKAAAWDPSIEYNYAFPWGDDWEAGRANTAAAQLGGLSAVQAFPADLSPYGLLGMSGNAGEWTQDWYYPDYEGLGTLNPARLGPQPLTEPFRVVRGGSFQALAAFARTGQRLEVNAETSASWVSFRCAADVLGAEEPTAEPGATEDAAATDDAAATEEPAATDDAAGAETPTATP